MLLAKLQDADKNAESEDYLREMTDVLDPDDSSRGLLQVSWRLKRRIRSADIRAYQPCVDICHPKSVALIRERLASLGLALGFDDISLSDILGSCRLFTQECSRMIHREGYSGIRYLSRYGEGEWECWALFADRVSVTPHPSKEILPTDPDLQEVAKMFQLTIEGPKGHYLRP